MNFRNWLRLGSKYHPISRSKQVTSKRISRYRLIVESLEDRMVLAPLVAYFTQLPPGNTAPENDSVNVSASASHLTGEAGTSTDFTYNWSVTKDGNVYFDPDNPTMPIGSSFVFYPDDNGTYVVCVTATDSDGTTSEPITATITVFNVPPYGSIYTIPPLPKNDSNTLTALVGAQINIVGLVDDSKADRPRDGSGPFLNFAWSVTKEGVLFSMPPETNLNTYILPFIPLAQGNYVFTLVVTDKDGGASTFSQALHVTALNASSLQDLVNYDASYVHSTSITVQTDSTQISTVIDAMDTVTAPLYYDIYNDLYWPAPVEVTLNLASGNYQDVVVNLQPNVTLIVNSEDGSATFLGGSPALIVNSGYVIVHNAKFQNATNAPTILVNGGNLTLRNDTIQESTGFAAAAISVTGGTVDLGTTADPGGNILNVNGTGELIHNTGTNPIPVIGNTFEKNATVLTSPYRIQDLIYSTAGTGGLVSFVDNNVYVTSGSANIQRGIDSVADGGIVNVESSVNARFTIGTKLATVKFDDGYSVGLQPDPLNPGQVMLVVTGTTGDDTIRINNADDDPNSIKVKLGNKDLGNFKIRGTASSNLSRIVVYGQAGNDTISVDNSITIPAWLYGGTGDDELNAGGGNDYLYGEDGNDKLFARGGAGSDRLDGGAGNDMLYAGTGGDMLFGGPGNDNLKGGSSNDILVGGDGDDLLAGGAGRDLLIGGLGADKLVGDAEDDILIAGATAFDANDIALRSIMAEWSSTRDYGVRLANLMGTGTSTNFQARLNGTVYLKMTGPDATVFDDGAVDVLTGNAGQDWFIFNATGSGVKDQVTDLKAGEFFTDLDILFINGV